MKKHVALTSVATLVFLGLATPGAQAVYQPPPTPVQDVVDTVVDYISLYRGNDECAWVPQTDGSYMKVCAPAGYLVPREFQSVWETLDEE